MGLFGVLACLFGVFILFFLEAFWQYGVKFLNYFVDRIIIIVVWNFDQDRTKRCSLWLAFLAVFNVDCSSQWNCYRFIIMNEQNLAREAREVGSSNRQLQDALVLFRAVPCKLSCHLLPLSHPRDASAPLRGKAWQISPGLAFRRKHWNKFVSLQDDRKVTSYYIAPWGLCFIILLSLHRCFGNIITCCEVWPMW